MTGQWNLINDVRRIGANVLEAEIAVPKDSVWFTGHFPGEPILPGIALIHTVYEAIEKDARERGESVSVPLLKKVRFTGPVRPGDNICLSLTGEDGSMKGLLTFKVAVSDKVICTGQVSVAKLPAQNM